MHTEIGHQESLQRPSRVIRAAGIATILGGALFMLPWGAIPSLLGMSIVTLLGVGLLVVGVGGFVKQYRETYGELGTAGTYTIGFGLASFVIGGLAVLFLAVARGNPLAPTQPAKIPIAEYALTTTIFFVGLAVLLAGAFALGISLWRADIGPRWSVGLLVLALPLFVAVPTLNVPVLDANLDATVATAAFGLAWIGLGTRLRAGTPDLD